MAEVLLSAATVLAAAAALEAAAAAEIDSEIEQWQVAHWHCYHCHVVTNCSNRTEPERMTA